jgi:tetratricopeptide (TPR) repeat protein
MLPEAERLLRSELAKQHQSSPPDLHSANLTNFLGIVLEDQGHYPEAEACFRQAASEFETILGPQHPRLATTLANLGNLLVEEGHYQEAYRSIWRAIDIATPVLGDRHPAVAIMFGDLGNLFHRQKEIAALFQTPVDNWHAWRNKGPKAWRLAGYTTTWHPSISITAGTHWRKSIWTARVRF